MNEVHELYLEEGKYYSLQIDYFEYGGQASAILQYESPSLSLPYSVIPSSNLYHNEPCDCTNTGFVGEVCNLNIDDCASNPCQNGDCTDGIKSYTCSCRSGFYGTNCEFTDSCISQPCKNGGTCLRDGSSYTCACTFDFDETDCEVPRGLCHAPNNPDPQQFHFNFPLETSQLSEFQVNGNTITKTSSFILSDSTTTNQKGSIFYKTPFQLTNPPSFSASFGFRIQPTGGEGLTFIIGNSPTLLNTGATSNLGYTGNPSLAIKFDTKQDSGEPYSSDYISILTNGNAATSALSYSEPGVNFDNGEDWYVWIDYDGQTLYIRYSQNLDRPTSPKFSAPITLTSIGGRSMYFGFSSASSTSSQHLILSYIHFSTFLHPFGISCRVGEHINLRIGQCLACAKTLYNPGDQACCQPCPANTFSIFDRSSCVGKFFLFSFSFFFFALLFSFHLFISLSLFSPLHSSFLSFFFFFSSKEHS